MTNRQRMIERLTTRLQAMRAEYNMYPSGKRLVFGGEEFRVLCPDVPAVDSHEMNGIVEGLAHELGLMDWYAAQTDAQYYRWVKQAYRGMRRY